MLEPVEALQLHAKARSGAVIAFGSAFQSREDF